MADEKMNPDFEPTEFETELRGVQPTEFLPSFGDIMFAAGKEAAQVELAGRLQNQGLHLGFWQLATAASLLLAVGLAVWPLQQPENGLADLASQGSFEEEVSDTPSHEVVSEAGGWLGESEIQPMPDQASFRLRNQWLKELNGSNINASFETRLSVTRVSS